MPQKVRTQLQWIAERARDKEVSFLSLAHPISEELLEQSHRELKKEAVGGVDGCVKEEYEQELSQNLQQLHEKLRQKRYRPQPVKRVWIGKAQGAKRRPLGLPAYEDKVVQKAVVSLLEPIYEENFYEFSYGYRKGKSCHQALGELRRSCMQGEQYIIDADIEDYFTSIEHRSLREFLKRRVKCRGLHRLIGRWLKAGILDGGRMQYPKKGTPQGSTISPLLANIYLHYVVDEWFEEQIKPRLKGRARWVRVADDFVICCQYQEDARRVLGVLPKRLGKYGLKLQESKTRMVKFTKPRDGEKGEGVIDFVGFRHYWSKSRQGHWVVKKKTAPPRLSRAMKAINQWCKAHRHMPMRWQQAWLRMKLQGHYNYFGVSCNYRSLQAVYGAVYRLWKKWLNRRGGRAMSWEQYEQHLRHYPLPRPRIVHVGV